jgi:hypothetical protein
MQKCSTHFPCNFMKCSLRFAMGARCEKYQIPWENHDFQFVFGRLRNRGLKVRILPGVLILICELILPRQFVQSTSQASASRASKSPDFYGVCVESSLLRLSQCGAVPAISRPESGSDRRNYRALASERRYKFIRRLLRLLRTEYETTAPG